MLLICPVRPGDTNEELRYAIRSWEAHMHLGSDLELWTVGHRPAWLAPDWHIPGNKYDSMPLAVWDNVRLGADSAVLNGYKTALYMNDDFFCMDPVGSVLPVKRDCTLAEQIAKYPGGPDLWWPKSLRLTHDWLTEAGFPHPDSYEVHRPLLCSPEGMIEALSRWDGGLEGLVPQWRTLYGVLNKVEAYPVVDAKLNNRAKGVGTPWISTSDASWRVFGPAIRKRFQKPSRWEK